MHPRQRHSSRATAKGFTLLELLIVVAIILIIVAIAIPNVLQTRIQADETAAVANLKMLNTALQLYHNNYDMYPAQLNYLAQPQTGNPTSSAADLIDQTLAGGSKTGYQYIYTQGPGGQSYTIQARPLQENRTGHKHFYTDETAITRSNIGADASISSTPM